MIQLSFKRDSKISLLVNGTGQMPARCKIPNLPKICDPWWSWSPSLQKTGKIDHKSMIHNDDQPSFEDLLLDASASSATHSLDLTKDVISAKYPSSDVVDHSSQEVILTKEDLERIYMFVQANVVSKTDRKMSDQKHEALPPPSRYVQRKQKHFVREHAQTQQNHATAFEVNCRLYSPVT